MISNHLLHQLQITILLHLAKFNTTNVFLNFNFEATWALWSYMYCRKTGYFQDKNLQGKSSSDLLLKNLQEAMYLASPRLGQVTYKI